MSVSDQEFVARVPAEIGLNCFLVAALLSP